MCVILLNVVICGVSANSVKCFVIDCFQYDCVKRNQYELSFDGDHLSPSTSAFI